MSTFLVTGATGRQGGSVVRELLAAGAKVQVLVRDETKQEAKDLAALGAILFVGDYSDNNAIARAVVGVEGIFLNPMPNFDDFDSERAQVQRFIDAVHSASPPTVKTIVISTVSFTAHHAAWLAEDPDYPMRDFNAGKLAAEDVVRASGVPNTVVLRPPWLTSNYVAPMCHYHFPSAGAGPGPDGVIEMRTPIRRDMLIAHLDPRDIGRIASAAFLHPQRFAGKTIAPGWRNITIVDVAREIEQVTGKAVKVVPQDPEELKRSKGPNSFMGGAWEWLNVHGYELTQAELDEVGELGIELRSLRTFLEDNKDIVFPPM
ncbi:NAD dependent epimerase/dehydratase [Auriculariales sp. MPI-PUGE-AT-0066]|nr:NAD dependent epimerase/dehydratase [Auriculariales sp. MPI-PUGE-AT-0066]